MRINVLHHASCFDGAASSAIFAAFYRLCVSDSARFAYIPKHHRRGDPFAPEDFAADEVAVLDFRYTSAEALVWYFDHHKSAFQLDGEREHYERDQSGRKFHDATAPSCTGYIAKIAHDRFGFDPTPHAELLRWAELIDSAAFPSPHMAVALEDPALRLMTFVEQNRDEDMATQMIDDLQTTPFDELIQADYVIQVVEPALERHADDIEMMRRKCRVQDAVGEFNLLDQPPRAYNKFIPYFLHPQMRYLVGVSNGADGRIKLSVGYNPWLPAVAREHDVAALCEQFEGGGHPYAGGVDFPPDQAEDALRAFAHVLAVLRGRAPP